VVWMCVCVILSCGFRGPLKGYPTSPFIVARGDRFLHVLVCKLSSVNGGVAVLILWRLIHFVLGAWLTAWLLLWRVAEPC